MGPSINDVGNFSGFFSDVTLFQKDLDSIVNDIVLTASVMGHTLENCTWVIHRHETRDK